MGEQQVPREESGARGVVLVPVLVLIAEGGQWWAPRSFLEMEIFAFLMFSTLARRANKANQTTLQPEPEFRRSTCLVRGCIVIRTGGRQ